MASIRSRFAINRHREKSSAARRSDAAWRVRHRRLAIEVLKNGWLLAGILSVVPNAAAVDRIMLMFARQSDA